MQLSKLVKPFLNRPRAVTWAVRLLIFTLAGLFAFLLRFDFVLNQRILLQIIVAIPIWVVVKAIVFHVFGFDRGHWHYASVPDIIRIASGSFAASCIALLPILWLAPDSFPRSVFVLDLLLCTGAIGVACLITRAVHDYRVGGGRRTGKRIAIYGAGQAGVTLLGEFCKNTRLGYNVCGFIDDNRHKIGMRIHDTPVLGCGRDLPKIAQRYAVQEVFIAIPSADGPSMMAILNHCHDAGLRCKTIPGLGEMIQNRALTPQIRDVAVDDLLGRTPVRLDETAIRCKLEDRVVLVTGAAGSIGSELCRQIARFKPRAIVGYEVAETPLFEIDLEMRKSFPDVLFFPEIGSIQNARRLAEVIKRHSPSILYHAAAYKHVPMMEAHPFEAVENNILGTATVAHVAAESGIDDFVMISSDKAVRPTNVMGASKRVAELIIHSLQSVGPKFVSVRFGNVLGSNGSVIPIFKKQIAAGGPVTITHPNMRRYFMTIPEAAQLVLQASTMGHGGEVFVLDMGQPVRIVDLARNLILLSGLRPDHDIRIEFTGIRPGEKLYEELSTNEENTVPTFHEKIKVFSGPAPCWADMKQHLAAIKRYCEMRDERRLFLEIKDIVPEYNLSAEILRRIIADEGVRQSAAVV